MREGEGERKRVREGREGERGRKREIKEGEKGFEQRISRLKLQLAQGSEASPR